MKTRPLGTWISFTDKVQGALPLPIPRQKGIRMFGCIFGAFFVVFFSIAIGSISSIAGQPVKTVSDLTSLLFGGFWTLGWMGGVIILGGITFLIFFSRETGYLTPDRLVRVAHLGPLRIRTDFEIQKIRNLRPEGAGTPSQKDEAMIAFQYGNTRQTLGGFIPRENVAKIIATIKSHQTGEARNATTSSAAPAEPPGIDASNWFAKERIKNAVQGEISALPPPRWTSLSTLTLVGANLIPVIGVFWWGWSLADIMILFWAESAVIGFYNVLKLFVVGKWKAIVTSMIFAGHYGGFMSGHFLFLYQMFIRGMQTRGPEEAVSAGLARTFGPVLWALAALFVSHGVSFFVNFIGKKEYLQKTQMQLMHEPYGRIILMHVTIIVGGTLVQMFGAPSAALVLLVALQIAADLKGHLHQHWVTARISINNKKISTNN